ncbi:MAG TPA: Rieske 2Fe-2S domain-containing protein [Candidatus Lustribacter sp.]|nr:Rieske 2Fe-2S domain-containing protein [Candidatus Lustribacter sp.]
MLSAEENTLLTKVTGDAPMGQMMRRYWVPAALSEEVAEPGGTPVRTTIFGERLVVFRDSENNLGVVDERCPHRLASLALGRNEEGGLRCIYHGWKFNTAGACIDMPTEPNSFGFRDRIKLASYPVREAGGMVWTYLGPADTIPAFPEYDWMKLPRNQYATVKVGERVNYAQAIEGAIDSSHSWFLHQGIIWDWKKRAEISMDTSPKLEAEDTSYGFRYAAIRVPTKNPDTEKYVRVTIFLVPFTAFIPRPLEKSQKAHIQVFVPVDDQRTIFYGVFFSQDGSVVDEAQVRRDHHLVPGEDLDRNWYKLACEDNWYNQDRAAMKNGSWTGINGFSNQDMACQESMGPIVDRTAEHLGTSDIAIIRMRKRMLEAVRLFQDGKPLIGLDPAIPYGKIRTEQLIVPIEQPWQSVGAYAGEYTPKTPVPA